MRDKFRVFLERHDPVLRALRAWTLRIVVPPHLQKLGQRAKQVVWNQLLTPLRAEMIDELRWYFGQAHTHAAPSRADDLDERFFHAREAFSAPRFRALYQMWKQDGDRVLADAGSRALDDAVTAAEAASRPLSSVTGTVISRPWSTSPEMIPRAPKGAEEGDTVQKRGWPLPNFRVTSMGERVEATARAVQALQPLV